MVLTKPIFTDTNIYKTQHIETSHHRRLYFFLTMNKTIAFLIIFCCLRLTSFSQCDSTTLCQASWLIDTIETLLLKTIHFENHEYFNSNQYIAVLEVPAESGLQLKYAYEKQRTKTSTIAQKHQAIAAINGSFFDMEKHHPVCYLRINGEEVGINVAGVDSINRKYYQYGTLVIDSNRMQILHTDSARFWERTLSYENIMTAGPLLIYRGEKIAQRNDLSFVNKRHNRTAIGIRSDGTILMLIVDGRFKQSEGLTLDELQSTLYWLGCSNAINLDGGGSTTLYIKGKGETGIINHPSDNGRYDHKGERGVSNAIIITK